MLCDNVWAFNDDPEVSRFGADTEYDGKMAVWTGAFRPLILTERAAPSLKTGQTI